MASNDAPQQEQKDVLAEASKMDDGWAAMSKYLQHLWGMQSSSPFSEITNTGSSSSSSNMGNLQIWNGGFRC